ncbi:hypothetical protein X744_12860 [Mesorhizobium sp. LNJC372A00]|nr:hypothetical protein X745_04215 [Mesorhizobium sp. LNJC374B00]ESY59441.1 hypothetical protein X744_12860 [Mesorhizobium sp. LNJC372A00]
MRQGLRERGKSGAGDFGNKRLGEGDDAATHRVGRKHGVTAVRSPRELEIEDTKVFTDLNIDARDSVAETARRFGSTGNDFQELEFPVWKLPRLVPREVFERGALTALRQWLR